MRTKFFVGKPGEKKSFGIRRNSDKSIIIKFIVMKLCVRMCGSGLQISDELFRSPK
jgi:hypothetical protein